MTAIQATPAIRRDLSPMDAKRLLSEQPSYAHIETGLRLGRQRSLLTSDLQAMCRARQMTRHSGQPPTFYVIEEQGS